jgi:hypothetical protein
MSLSTRILMWVVSAALCAACGYSIGTRITLARWNADKTVQAKAALAAVQAARTEEQQQSTRTHHAQTNQLQAVVKKAADNDAVSRERDSLRDQVRAYAASGQTLEAAHQRAATLGELLESCSREYQGMARSADGHALDVRALADAWPR